MKEKPERMTAGVRYTKVLSAEGTHTKRVGGSRTAVPGGFQVLNL